MYTIDPAMSFGEVILYYEKYLTETKAEGKKTSILPAFHYRQILIAG